MPKTEILLFKDRDQTVPFLVWLLEQEPNVAARLRARLARLAELGHELRRPEADYLRDGIYELRVGMRGRNYRVLYGFVGQQVVLVSHGIVKEQRVPPKEIDLAIERKKDFEHDPNGRSAARFLPEGPPDA